MVTVTACMMSAMWCTNLNVIGAAVAMIVAGNHSQYVYTSHEPDQMQDQAAQDIYNVHTCSIWY